MEKKKINRPELSAAVTTSAILSSINFENLDAIYLGQPYCLMVRGNLLVNTEDLTEAIKIVKKAGKRAYVTTPIVPKGKDFNKVEETISTAVKAGVDALEVHDTGVFRWAIKNFSSVPLHLSSLANIYQPETAAFYRDQGVARVVPANELLATEIKTIKDAVKNMQFSVPIHGKLPLGMSYACLLRLRFPSRDIASCRQQCADEHYLNMGNWRMRCVGTSLVTGDDYSLIEHLPSTIADGFAGFRMETHFDSAVKINALADVYRQAIDAVSNSNYPRAELLSEVKKISGELCNGWHFGLSGHAYFSAVDEDPLAAAVRELGVRG